MCGAFSMGRPACLTLASQVIRLPYAYFGLIEANLRETAGEPVNLALVLK